MASAKKPFHVVIADKLIEQLKQGTAPWQKPWAAASPSTFLPMNPTTGKRYKGINAIQLLSENYSDTRWLTYRQAQEAGAQVRKGEKGTSIQYWKFTETQRQADDLGAPIIGEGGRPVTEEVRLERPRVFFATVFNAEQIEGIAPREVRATEWSGLDRVERAIQMSGAKILHDQSDRALYRIGTDRIHLPERSQFSSADRYYATLLHELGHWTGHATRLDRDLSHPFGSVAYAKEELRAEIASMILGDKWGIGHDPGQHVAYVGSWIKVLQEDPMEIFRAAADAEKIQMFIGELEQLREQSKDVANAVPMYSTSEIVLTDYAVEEGVVSEKQFINVPYSDKDEAKNLGARWDRQQQRWFIPTGIDAEAFAKWKQDGNLIEEMKASTNERRFIAVPYGEHKLVKAAGAIWDKAARSWYIGSNADVAKLTRWLPDNIARHFQSPAISPNEEFADALKTIGAIIDGVHPVMDGQTHRIRVDGDKTGEAAGFYVGHLDGHPAGYMKNNRTGLELTWRSKGYSITPEQKAKLHAEVVARAQTRAAEQEQQHEKAASRIADQMTQLVSLATPTPYLIAKQIPVQNGIFTDAEGKTTYVPAQDVDGKIWSMQYIKEDGTKRFAKNSRKEACFHVIGGFAALTNAPAIVLAEGYATASTLTQALGFATVAAFDSGNLPHVAKALHARFPNKPIVIAGDDDLHLMQSQGINPGREKAEEAARVVKGKAVFPIFAPGEQSVNPKRFTDFNDLATNSVLGMDSVERQVKGVVSVELEKHRQVRDRGAQREAVSGVTVRL